MTSENSAPPRGFCRDHGKLVAGMGRVEGKLDTTIESMREWRADIKTDLATLKHDVADRMEDTQEVLANGKHRIRKLERWKWYLAGGAGALIFILSQVPNIIRLVEWIK